MTAKALPSRFQLGEHANRLHVHECPAAVTPEMLLDPSYWSLVAPRVRLWDKVQVQREDGTFWAEYLVVDADGYRVVLEPITVKSLSRKVESAEVPAGYTISHQGPKLKWSVTRDKDKNRIHSGSQSEPEALSWLLAHLRSAEMRAA